MKILQPPSWTEPRGYANGTMAEMQVGSRIIFVGGQIGWNGQQVFETDNLAEQVGQTLRNIVDVLKAGGAGPEHITRMTWYVVDKGEYTSQLREIGQQYRATLGRHFAAMTAFEVAALIEDRARVEIEVTAVVPPEA